MEGGRPPRSMLAVLSFLQGWKGLLKIRFPKQAGRYASLAPNPVYWNRAMDLRSASILRWLFDPERGARDRLLPRWLFLRALGAIYFSVFFSLLFQIRGLIGPTEFSLPSNTCVRSPIPSASRVSGTHPRFFGSPAAITR
jgi:hypothetical protein